MKVGESVAVTIAGQVVAQAKIVELGTDTVTLIVPATQVVMAVEAQITTPEPVEPSKQVIIDSVSRREPTPVADESAPVGENPTIDVGVPTIDADTTNVDAAEVVSDEPSE